MIIKGIDVVCSVYCSLTLLFLLLVTGYAWSGGGRKVIRVDLTKDGGDSWQQAKLLDKPETPRGRDYSWYVCCCSFVAFLLYHSLDNKVFGFLSSCCYRTLFEARVKAEEGDIIHSRATDDAYNTQPKEVHHLWNMRGVLNTAWSSTHIKS